jgi:hypothetical protein
MVSSKLRCPGEALAHAIVPKVAEAAEQLEADDQVKASYTLNNEALYEMTNENLIDLLNKIYRVQL